MRYELLKNQARKQILQDRISKKYATNIVAKYGRTVRQVSAMNNEILLKILKAISSTDHDREFYEGSYYIESKSKYIEKLVPASNFLHTNFLSLVSHYDSFKFSCREVRELRFQIEKAWALNREQLPNTGQYSLTLGNQVNLLKMRLASFLFFSRSFLDAFATTLQYLNGIKSSQYKSFSDYRKKVISQNLQDPFSQHLILNLQWFDKLRDYRDYVTHVGAIEISMFENDGCLEVVLNHTESVSSFLDEVDRGLTQLTSLIDEYFSRKILEKSNRINDVTR